MRILNLVLGVLLIGSAAVVYAGGPKIDFVDKHTVERFIAFATPTLTLTGIVLVAVAILLPPGKPKPNGGQN